MKRMTAISVGVLMIPTGLMLAFRTTERLAITMGFSDAAEQPFQISDAEVWGFIGMLGFIAAAGVFVIAYFEPK